MKNKNLLWATACCCCAAVAFILGVSRHSDTRKPAGISETQKSESAGNSLHVVHEGTPIPRVDWRRVESEDYRTYIKNLQAIGCPEATVRDIIVADVNALFDSKRKAAITNRFEYWKTGSTVPRQWARAALVKEREALEAERISLLKELLGPDFVPEARPIAISDDEVRDALATALPGEVRAEALAAIKEADTRYDSDFKPYVGTAQWNDQKREDYRRYRTELDARLAAVLGPEAKEDYDISNSPLAISLRYTLRGINVSEESFGNCSALPSRRKWVSMHFFWIPLCLSSCPLLWIVRRRCGTGSGRSLGTSASTPDLPTPNCFIMAFQNRWDAGYPILITGASGFIGRRLAEAL